MLAADFINEFAGRGITVSLNGDGIAVQPASALTDWDRTRLKTYKTELLWRLRRPEGDPDASGYQVPVFVDGERVRIPLDRLIAEGKEIIAREGIPPSKLFNEEMQAAYIALSRYDEVRRQWVQANEIE